MYTKRAELTAGLVVLAALAVFLWFLYVATGKGFFQEYATWHVRFAQGEAASEVGDDVVYLGVPVGRVSKVEQRSEVRSGERLTEEDRARLTAMGPGAPQQVREIYLLAELELPPSQRLPRGTKAKLSSNAVTGRPTLHLLPGFSVEDLTPEESRNDPIRAAHTPTLDDIVRKVDKFIDDLAGSTKDVGGVLSEAKAFVQELRAKVAEVDTKAMNDNVLAATESLRKALAVAERDIDAIASNLKAGTGDLKTLAASGAEAVEKIRRDLDEILASIKSASKTVDETVQRNAPKVDKFLDDADALAVELRALAKDLQGIGPDIRAFVQNLGGDMDGIMANLEDASRNILDATEDIRANPWKLTTKPDGTVIAFENLKAASIGLVRAMTRMERAGRDLNQLLARPDAKSPEVQATIRSALAAFKKATEDFEAAQRRFAELIEKAGPKANR